MPTFNATHLAQMGRRLLEAANVPADTAQLVSASLVEGNLTGHDSHGVIRLVQYIRGVERGQINPRAELEIVRETATTALIDAHWAFGQVAARRAMEIAIAKAKQHSLAAVGLRNSSHIGRLGEYALLPVEHGLIGFVTCNSSQLTAPFGGVDRVFGTNPFAYGFPRSGTPFLMDFATSVTAEGKLRVAVSKGVPIPEGQILDRDRNPSTNPADFYDGGVILPLGGHKGYGLLMVADLLGGALTGHGCTSLPEHSTGNGVFMMAIDIAAFCPVEELTDTVDRLAAYIKAGNTAPGFDEILIPGEPEFRAKEQRLRDGITLPDSVWQEMVAVGGQYGLSEDALTQRE